MYMNLVRDLVKKNSACFHDGEHRAWTSRCAVRLVRIDVPASGSMSG
jgi:hypothetical protein